MALQTPGIVLKSVKYGEADLFLTVFTRKMGKISVFARNARKINNAFMGVSQLFSYSNLTLRFLPQGYQLVQGELLRSYYDLTKEMQRMYLGYYFLELTEKVLEEHQKNTALFDSLTTILELLESKGDPQSLKIIFQWKTLLHIGLRPEYQRCIQCKKAVGSKEGFVFNLREGGVQCRSCIASLPESPELFFCDSVLYELMSFMEKNDPQTILEAYIAPVVLHEMGDLLEKYYLYQLPELILNTKYQKYSSPSP